MPQCQFLFSAVFGFRKAVMEIFSELDETKSQMLIFPDTFQKSEGETKWGSRAPSPHGGAGGPPAVPPYGERAPRLHRRCPFAYKFPRRENPKTPSHYSRKHPLPPPPSTLTREGVQKFSFGTLPERGIITGGLYIAMPASGVMRE